MDSLDQVRLYPLMSRSSGDKDLSIGLIDGPIDVNHPAFNGISIRTVKDSQFIACKNANSRECRHGTFVAGILAAKRGVSAPSICPNCELVVYPIFNETATEDMNIHAVTPEELAYAILETVDTKVKIINVSLGMPSSSLIAYPELQEAYEYALKHGTILVFAAGNQGTTDYISYLNYSWNIPVASCDKYGRLDQGSNFGPSIRSRGLMAPGVNITSTFPGGEYTQMSGTSFAAPFVTGTIALLMSVFPKINPADIVHSIRKITSNTYRTIIPPLLDAESAFNLLKVL
jgi:subtilisin family serine protease